MVMEVGNSMIVSIYSTEPVKHLSQDTKAIEIQEQGPASSPIIYRKPKT